MNFETLKVEISADRVGIITMNRPDARNAMNTKMMEELRDCFASFYVDPEGGLPRPHGRPWRLLLGRRPEGAQGHD